jgi:hypothetical protein
MRLHLPEDLAPLFLASIESTKRDLDRRALEVVAAVQGSPPSLTAARLFRKRDLPVPAWVGLLALLEDYVRV